MEKITLAVEGMSCEHCVKKVEIAIQDQAGVEKVKVNLNKGIAKIKYDESINTLGQLTKAVKEAGYAATQTK